MRRHCTFLLEKLSGLIFDPTMEVKVLRWDKPVAPEEDKIRLALIKEGYSVFKWADSAGTVYHPHHHSHHESIWILEGEIEFAIDQNRIRLKPGDRLFLPRGQRHAAIVPSAENCFYLIGEKD